MKLTLQLGTATNSFIEATFDEDAEMQPVIFYNSRRVKLTPWKAGIIEKAFNAHYDIPERIADALAEKRHSNYSY